MTSKKCPGCGRMIPIHKKRWQRHYIQDKNWTGPNGGPRTLCDNSEEIANLPPESDRLTEADYQTWMRL